MQISDLTIWNDLITFNCMTVCYSVAGLVIVNCRDMDGTDVQLLTSSSDVSQIKLDSV